MLNIAVVNRCIMRKHSSSTSLAGRLGVRASVHGQRRVARRLQVRHHELQQQQPRIPVCGNVWQPLLHKPQGGSVPQELNMNISCTSPYPMFHCTFERIVCQCWKYVLTAPLWLFQVNSICWASVNYPDSHVLYPSALPALFLVSLHDLKHLQVLLRHGLCFP